MSTGISAEKPRCRPCFFFLMIRPPPRSTLFPSTTLFRSRRLGGPDSPRRTAPSGSASERERSRSRSEEHTSELQSRGPLVCRLLLETKKSLRVRLYVRTYQIAPTHIHVEDLSI